MKRSIIEQSLAQAQDHVLLGQMHIAHQRELIAKIGGGDDAREAHRLLETFEELQKEHVSHRDRLALELLLKGNDED